MYRPLRVFCVDAAFALRCFCAAELETTMGRRYVLVSMLVLVSCVLLAVETAGFTYQKPLARRKDTHVEVAKSLGWGQTHDEEGLTAIDADILPDYWEPHLGVLFEVDPRVPTNGAEPPEQLVKVTDRRHKFPVFATICSISFLATVITLLIVCTS